MRAIAKFCRTQHDIAHEHDGVHYANLVVGVRVLNQQVGVLASHEPNHDADTVEKESVLNENPTHHFDDSATPICASAAPPDRIATVLLRRFLVSGRIIVPQPNCQLSLLRIGVVMQKHFNKI